MNERTSKHGRFEVFCRADLYGITGCLDCVSADLYGEACSAEKMMKLQRITTDPAQMSGVPCIRGLRIPVATVVSMVAERMSREEILRAYPDLEPQDIDEAMAFAAEAVRERGLPLVPIG